MISREKCIKNLNELIEVIDKESDEIYNTFYAAHPQQVLWSVEAEKEFNSLKEQRQKTREMRRI